MRYHGNETYMLIWRIFIKKGIIIMRTPFLKSNKQSEYFNKLTTIPHISSYTTWDDYIINAWMYVAMVTNCKNPLLINVHKHISLGNLGSALPDLIHSCCIWYHVTLVISFREMYGLSWIFLTCMEQWQSYLKLE